MGKDIREGNLKRIAFVANTAWSLYNFRMGVMLALQKYGHEVVAIAPPDNSQEKIQEKGIEFIPITLNSSGTNPFQEIGLLNRLLCIYKEIQPDLIFHYTVKLNIWGSMAAKLAKVPCISIVPGLGYAFHDRKWLRFIVEQLYRIAFKHPEQIWFLNKEDKEFFIKERLVLSQKTRLLPGEGIDTDYFSAKNHPRSVNKKGATSFLLSGRLLWEKGIGIYLDAAKIIKEKYPETKFNVLGFLDDDNPGSLSKDDLIPGINAGVIRYLGETEDVRPFLASCDCFVMPSFYGEGQPRSLLEAASLEIPIITTDTPGCNDVVKNNENGFLCQPKSVADLVKKMEVFIHLPPHKRKVMGQIGRKHVEQHFHERFVIEHYMVALQSHLDMSECLSPVPVRI